MNHQRVNAPASAPRAVDAAACWLNGRLVPRNEARVSVFDHGLLYGDGVFEGIRFYRGRPFRLARHLARLRASANAIRLNIPYDDAALTDALTETIAAFGAANGYLRLVVTRGEGRLGIDPSSCECPTVFIIADHLSLVPAAVQRDGADVIVAATRRIAIDALDPRVKSLNYLNPILARIEAAEAGVHEAILLNAAGRVTEGSADNIFIVRDGELLTPPTNEGALEGITREAIIEIAHALTIVARERSLVPQDLYDADECFLTGTGAELIPVRTIDGKPLPRCPGPVYSALQKAFHALVERETAISADRA